MRVLKNLYIKYKDGKEFEYPISLGMYEMFEYPGFIQVNLMNQIHCIHILRDIEEYTVKNIVRHCPEVGEDTDKKTHILIHLKNGERIKYEDMELKVMEATLEVRGIRTIATFLLRDVSGWEVREG